MKRLAYILLPAGATLGLLLLLLMAPPARAQQAPTCEDALRTTRIYLEQVLAARARTEAEAAQALAGLVKRLEQLQADLARLAPKAGPPEAK